MPGDDKMLERVRRLLAKAEGATTEAERDAYNGKAAELIARYGIEEALLAAKQSQPQAAGDRIVDLDSPYARDKGSLLASVASPLGVRAVLRTGRAGPAGTVSLSMHLFGMESDLTRVDLLYTSLLVQAAHGLAIARPRDARESVAAYRRSWMIGFAYTIGERLIAAEAAVRAEAEAAQSAGSASGPGGAAGPSVSLVLADRAAIVDREVEQTYPRLRNAPRRQLSGSGSAEGAAAGRRADLGGKRLSRRGRSALH
jgi:Protein of unknown function (DUF2786)